MNVEVTVYQPKNAIERAEAERKRQEFFRILWKAMVKEAKK